MKTNYLFLAALIFVSVTSAAQQNCAYTFTWSKPSFSFCVTNYGTIGMIQAPVGTNHLDPANPVEGFAWNIDDSGGGQMVGAMIPGLGVTRLGLPNTFQQPGGPGTLPLIITWSADWNRFGGFRETITANASHRTITLNLTIKDCGSGCLWSGFISRVATTKLDGNSVSNFGSSKWAAFAFLNHGLMLSVPDTSLGCGGIDSTGASSTVYETCGGGSFTGTGAIFADYSFDTSGGHRATQTFTYGVF
jgi:hypothetical protein